MYEIERHPWPPFIPAGARVLILGTFPPGPHRWSMDFYYPNRTNDFWRICGLLFMGDPLALYDAGRKTFRLPEIKALLTERGIALNDTGRAVRRTRGNASDKYLEIVEQVPLYDLLDRMPDCHTLATTGQKAAEVIASITGTEVPPMGSPVAGPDGLTVWRMPSTSRAYPMKLEDKAAHYERMFRSCGVL